MKAYNETCPSEHPSPVCEVQDDTVLFACDQEAVGQVLKRREGKLKEAMEMHAWQHGRAWATSQAAVAKPGHTIPLAQH